MRAYSLRLPALAGPAILSCDAMLVQTDATLATSKDSSSRGAPLCTLTQIATLAPSRRALG